MYNILQYVHFLFWWFVLCSHEPAVFLNNMIYHLFQITVYLGKRDFVDHLDQVDSVGELTPHLEFHLI